MYNIQMTTQFKRDLKKYNRNTNVVEALDHVVKKLLHGKQLEQKYCDHPLNGIWKESRDCHLKPNVVLIYRIDKKSKILILERIGSHAQLFR